MRYFLVSYTAKRIRRFLWNKTTLGHAVLQHKKMPNLKFFLADLSGRLLLKQSITAKDIIITNIYEFNNEEDYNEFIK